MENKWTVSSSETVLNDRWINVRADACVTPHGKTIDPYYVLTYPDWVHIVAITPDGSLVLVRQYRHASGEVITELPAGSVDKNGEDIEQAARRELAEETGYAAESWKLISTLHANPALQTNRMHVFLALGATRTEEQQLDDGEEGMTVQVVPIPEVVANLTHGIIGQQLQVSSLLLALLEAKATLIKSTDCAPQAL